MLGVPLRRSVGSKAALLESPDAHSVHVVGRGYTDTHVATRGGREMRSDRVQGGAGNMMGQCSPLPRALKGLFGRSDELLHTKPLRLAP